MHVYDQARTSSDGKYFIIYGMDNSITKIPVQGTEFMPGDSQRLPHYIAPSGRVFYVRHPAGTMTESIISEGTWALPDSPEAVDELTALMQQPLAASFAADKLYSLVGDDHLFDLIAGMKEQNPGQNIWKNPAVAKRFYELGIEMNVAEGFGTIGTIPASGTGGRGQSPSGHAEPMSDDEDEMNLSPGSAQDNQVPQTGTQQTGKSTTLHIDQNGNLALGDEEDPKNLRESTDDLVNIIMGHQADVKKYTGGNGSNMSSALSQELQAYYNTNDFAKQFDSDLAAIFKAADQHAPAQESINEMTEAGLKAILDQYADSFAKFKAGGEIDDNVDFYEALYSYYSDAGEMPYGTQKARDGDPVQWIADRLDAETGMMPVAEENINEGAEFGAYYSEQLAQKVFDQNPNLSCEGKCEELLDAAWPIAVADLGRKRAQYEFGYNEDFPSDFVSAYIHLQKQSQGVTEGQLNEFNSSVYVVNYIDNDSGEEKQLKIGAYSADDAKAKALAKLRANGIDASVTGTTGGETDTGDNGAREWKQVMLRKFAHDQLKTEYEWAAQYDVFMTKEQILEYIDVQATDKKLTPLEFMHNNGYEQENLFKGFLNRLIKAGFSKQMLLSMWKSFRKTGSVGNVGPGTTSAMATALLKNKLGETANITEEDEEGNYGYDIKSEYMGNRDFELLIQNMRKPGSKPVQVFLRVLGVGEWSLSQYSLDSFQLKGGVKPVGIQNGVNGNHPMYQAIFNHFDLDTKMWKFLGEIYRHDSVQYDRDEDYQAAGWPGVPMPPQLQATDAGEYIDKHNDAEDQTQAAISAAMSASKRKPATEAFTIQRGDKFLVGGNSWVSREKVEQQKALLYRHKSMAQQVLNKIGKPGDKVVMIENEEEASPEEQGAADKNIIMQIRKVADYERPSPVTLGDGESITIDADTARTILAKFDTLKPDSKALMQQTLNTSEGFHELLNYFNKRKVHEDVELISTAMKPVMEADARAKRLMKKVFGI